MAEENLTSFIPNTLKDTTPTLPTTLTEVTTFLPTSLNATSTSILPLENSSTSILPTTVLPDEGISSPFPTFQTELSSALTTLQEKVSSLSPFFSSSTLSSTVSTRLSTIPPPITSSNIQSGLSSTLRSIANLTTPNMAAKTTTPNVPETTTPFPKWATSTSGNLLENVTTSNLTSSTLDDVNRTASELPFYLKFRDEPWVVPLVSLALLNVAAILIFEAYVLYKSCGGKRHLFSGQVLLLGLLFASALALVYVPEPHWLLCGITRAGVGILYSVIFGVLLVKCIFLLKFHYGVYFNASFQALMLFFIVAVEVAIVTQWLVYQPADVESLVEAGKGVSVVCNLSPLDRIPYLSYVMLLLLMVIIASVRARSLRENNREAAYIGVSIGLTVILWVAWTSVSIIFDRRYEAPAEAFGLSCTALVVFLLVFVPKAVQLGRKKAGQGHGRGSHVHTPSFLHLQPQAILPGSHHSTLVKQQSAGADYCRDGYSSNRLWRYDLPSFHQMETPTLAVSDMNSTKKSNGSSHHHSHIY